jgi:putative ABC transport system substrate-binding protein
VLDDIFDLAEIERRARAIIASRPDAILISPHVDATLFKRLTRDVPIVFWTSGDPVRMGLVESLRRPGGNFTGASDRSVELMVKSYQLFRELRPGLKRVGILMDDATTDDDRALVRDAQGPTAKRLGLERVEIVVPMKATVAQVEGAIRASRVEALDVALSGDGDLVPWTKDAMKFIERSGILAAWDHPGLVRDGGLLSVGGNLREIQREAVRIVARILRGTKPGDIPVYEGRGVRIALNLRTARAMGLAVPESVLLQATYIFR